LRSNGAHQSVDKNVVMLLADESLYTPRALWFTPTSDLRDMFGFDVAIVDESNYAVLSDHDSVRLFTSNTAPIKNSTRQAFIKIDSLNIESFNGGTSDISILEVRLVLCFLKIVIDTILNLIIHLQYS
jgi:hypothetical protein